MLFRVAAFVLVSIVCFGANSPQIDSSGAGNKPPTVPVRLAKSSMPMMPLVAPLFVANTNISSILTLVHDLPEPVSVDVSIIDKSGRPIVTFKQTIPPHGQAAVVMNDKLRDLRIMEPILGSLTVTPRDVTVTLGAQLSFIRSEGPLTSGFEEELVMLNPSIKNIFRSVATGAAGLPIVAVKNLANRAQAVTFSCLEEGERAAGKTFSLGPQRMELVTGCRKPDIGGLNRDGFFTDNERRQPKVVGISIESNGDPESLAVFGVAPRSGIDYEPLAFTQVGSLRSNDTVYPGIPVGPTRAFESDQFLPELGLTNFLGTPAHVTVSYFSPVANPDGPKVIADMQLAPYTATRIPIAALPGDQDMQNSILVSASGENGQVISTLRAVRGGGSPFVEIPREDRKKPTDGGNHPWIVDQNTDSYLVLFNADKNPHTVGVSVYAANSMTASNGIAVKPDQTTVLDLQTLADLLVHPNAAAEDLSNSTREPRQKQSGLVTWLSLDGDFIFGRVIQISNDRRWSRNFSCPVEYIACGALISPSTLNVAVSGTNTANGYALICPSVGQCTCDGSGACTGQTQQVLDNYWQISGGAASISGSNSGSQVSISGNSAGTATLDLSVTDSTSQQCVAGTLGVNSATVVVKRVPNHLKVVSDTFGPQTCPAGYSATLRQISYEIDDVNNQPITPSVSVREHFDAKSPSNGTTTCNGNAVTTAENCTQLGASSVGFVDGISPGCALSSAPTSCGWVFTNQAWYACNTGGSDYVIGRTGTLNVTKGGIFVGSNSTGFASGTVFTGP